MRSLPFVLLLAASCFAEKMQVHILDRQIQTQKQTAIVPGPTPTSRPYIVPTSVHWSSFTIVLPDHRQVIAYCGDDMGSFARHKCMLPVGDDLEADFSGDHVTISWPTSIDGKKNASQKYKIYKIIDPAN